MTIEISLLKALSIRKNLDSYIHHINPKTLSRESLELIRDYQAYFSSRDNNSIDFNDFSTFLFIERHPNLDDKSVEKWKDIISKVHQLPLEGKSCAQIITAFEQQELYAALHQDLDRNIDIAEVSAKLDTAMRRIQGLNSAQEAEDDGKVSLKESLTLTDRTAGLQWKLKCLNEAIGGLIKSDFVIFAAYPGKGKTSFLASQVTYMATQIKPDQQILWFNNEGNKQKINNRLYCSFLKTTESGMRQNQEEAERLYKERIGGDEFKIRIFDIKGKSTKHIEKIVAKYNPGLIIIDMLDKVSGFEIYLKGESGSVDRYDQLYAWAEKLSDIAPVIATSQCNYDGFNVDYPPMTALKGSTVAKQGNIGILIMMGALESCQEVRYLSTPKNKAGGKETFRASVKFDPLRSYFED